MKTTTVSKLKASLSEYLRSVKAGEEVLVTERGRPVAKLSPAAGSDVLADHLIEMEKHGLLKVGAFSAPFRPRFRADSGHPFRCKPATVPEHSGHPLMVA